MLSQLLSADTRVFGGRLAIGDGVGLAGVALLLVAILSFSKQDRQNPLVDKRIFVLKKYFINTRHGIIFEAGCSFQLYERVFGKVPRDIGLN